jgi:DNA-binding transcriptional MerR regulator
VYAPQDLERLEQIVALKFIGIPLAEIKRLLERDALGMAQALRLRGPGGSSKLVSSAAMEGSGVISHESRGFWESRRFH